MEYYKTKYEIYIGVDNYVVTSRKTPNITENLVATFEDYKSAMDLVELLKIVINTKAINSNKETRHFVYVLEYTENSAKTIFNVNAYSEKYKIHNRVWCDTFKRWFCCDKNCDDCTLVKEIGEYAEDMRGIE